MSFFGFTAPEWHESALCAQVGGDLWFPEKGEQTSEARLICKRCPVQDECLEHALTQHEPYGIWGSKSARERSKMRGSAA